MTKFSCHCGAVNIAVAQTPAFIHACNCSLCRKSGAQWGYFRPEEIELHGQTTAYVRADKPGAGAEIHFCPRCGATTHFVLTPEMIAAHGNSVAGVNMALADEDALAGIERRYPDGKSWDGQGPFTYLREAQVIGAEIRSS